MEFRILGALDVRGQAGSVPLGGNRSRAVLALLLLHANQPVAAERLAVALWGDDAPAQAVGRVRVQVHRLRRALGDPQILTTTPAGYCLNVQPGALDADRFRRLVDEGRRILAGGDAGRAAAVLREALALWRGAPPAGPPVGPLAVGGGAQARGPPPPPPG